MSRKGLVVEVHPRDHSVDLVMSDDGSRLVGVQVQTPNGSTRSGTVDLPEIPVRKDKWDISQPTGQDMHAVVDFIGRQPVVTGFLYPQVNQMTSADPKLRIDRHQSDVIKTIDGAGNYQLSHPSGLFFRIGAAPEKQDFAGQNADANSAVDRNTDTTPYVRLYTAGGKLVLTVEPSGKLVLSTEDAIDVHAKGSVTVKTEADAMIEAAGNATVKAELVTSDAPLTKVTGDLAVAGGMTVAGAATMSGSLDVEGDTKLKAVTSNGKNISDGHSHSGVRAGSDNSGAVT